jgi:hypothetical protein
VTVPGTKLIPFGVTSVNTTLVAGTVPGFVIVVV